MQCRIRAQLRPDCETRQTKQIIKISYGRSKVKIQSGKILATPNHLSFTIKQIGRVLNEDQ